MRGWLIAALVAAALWTAYWFAGARGVDLVLEDGFAAASRAGLVAGHDGLTVTGFPARFDASLTRPHLQDPARGIGWSAPGLDLSARALQPLHITAELPRQQSLTLPDQDVAIASSNLSLTVRLQAGTSLPLGFAGLEGNGLSLLSSAGWTAAAARVTLDLTALPKDPLGQDLHLSATSITPDEGFRRRLALRSGLPELIRSVQVDAGLGLSAPLDRRMGQTRPQLTALHLRDARLVWGELTVSAKGELQRGPDGLAEGRLLLRVQGWRDLLAVMLAAGWVKPELEPTLSKAMEVLAEETRKADPDSPPQTLDLPLVLSGGWIRLGPLPLGPVPPF